MNPNRHPLPQHRSMWAHCETFGPTLVATDCSWRCRVVPLPSDIVEDFVRGHHDDLHASCTDCGATIDVRPMPEWMRQAAREQGFLDHDVNDERHQFFRASFFN